MADDKAPIILLIVVFCMVVITIIYRCIAYVCNHLCYVISTNETRIVVENEQRECNTNSNPTNDFARSHSSDCPTSSIRSDQFRTTVEEARTRIIANKAYDPPPSYNEAMILTQLQEMDLEMDHRALH